MKPFIAAISTAVLLGAACANETSDDRVARLDGHVEFFAPESAPSGPPALVLLLSGCGGLVGGDGPKTIMTDYAAIATQMGAYAAVIDSMGARGIDFDAARAQVCSGLRLRGRERAGDLTAARQLAEEHWALEFDTLIAAGWSHGGWAVMEQLRLDTRPDAPHLNPDAVVLVYPYCGLFNSSRRGGWAFRGPVLHLSAELDTLSPAERCRDIIIKAHGGADGVDSHVFEGATHAFDEADQTAGSRYVFNPETTAEAHALFGAFIAQQITSEP